MSDPSQKPWSDNPNAPQIPHDLYVWEKAVFAGAFIGVILYGIVIMMFFQCITALFDPANRRREGTKWGLVIYTVLTFSFVTIRTVMGLNSMSISFIDNREFPGVSNQFAPGPVGYTLSVCPEVTSIVPGLAFLLNNWLANGLLLYRCYVIYSMNLWAIALPCFTYLGSLATGIMVTYWTAQPGHCIRNSVLVNYGISYLSISLSLNILLTLMIVTRLVLHSRNIRTAMGASSGLTGLYKTVVTMLIESSAVFTASSLLFLGFWGSRSHIGEVFSAIYAEAQAIAPLLIIQRVASQRALTSKSFAAGNVSSINFRSRDRTMDGSEIIPGGYPVVPVGRYGRSSVRKSSDVDIGVETVIDFHQDGEV